MKDKCTSLTTCRLYLLLIGLYRAQFIINPPIFKVCTHRSVAYQYIVSESSVTERANV